jgi:hypothetical protein
MKGYAMKYALKLLFLAMPVVLLSSDSPLPIALPFSPVLPEPRQNNIFGSKDLKIFDGFVLKTPILPTCTAFVSLSRFQRKKFLQITPQIQYVK